MQRQQSNALRGANHFRSHGVRTRSSRRVKSPCTRAPLDRSSMCAFYSHVVEGDLVGSLGPLAFTAMSMFVLGWTAAGARRSSLPSAP